VTGIKEAGHKEIQPLLCCVAEVVAVMTGLAAQGVLLMTDTTREALQLPLSHICFTPCVFTIRFLSVFWREFCSCLPYHYDCVTNGHGVCPIVMPCFHVPEAYG